MKTPAESEQLLDALLCESGPHEALLERTLQAVRQRREARRRRRHLIGPVLVLVATSLLLWRPWQPRLRVDAGKTAPATPGSGLIVRTAPTPAALLASTIPGTASVIDSAPTIAVLRTPPMTAPIPLVDDSELFGFLAGRPAAIIRPRYGLAELLLLDPAERVGASGEQ